MRFYDFVVVGGGIAGLLSAWFLRDFNTLLIDKKEPLSGASGAAGAFLFPKVGFDSLYTRFINEGILKSVEFYKNLGVRTNTKGVLILPRDEKDIGKFKLYEKDIKLPFKKMDGGFFFEVGSVVNPDDVKRVIKVNFLQKYVKKIVRKDNFWIIDNEIKAKNIILATGYESVFDIPYINIRPIWGERIEGKADNITSLPYHFHKNCSVGEIDGIVKIGATHKRNCEGCKENFEEAYDLISKANEIIDIKNFVIFDIKGGFRAASVDYFPVVGKIIDTDFTLLSDRHIVKGDMPKEIFFIEGLYIINGMGGRGFSNAYMCAKALRDYIIEGKSLEFLDTERLFIKWARKKGEEYLRRLNVKSR